MDSTSVAGPDGENVTHEDCLKLASTDAALPVNRTPLAVSRLALI